MIKIILTSVVTVFALFVSACTAPATTTELPPTSTTSLGILKGTLVGTESQSPLRGAKIVLGLVTTENKCILKTNLSGTVNEGGSFEITEIPSGLYIVFYDPSQKERNAWENMDGVEMYVGVEGLFAPQSSAYASAREQLFSTFGGESTIMVKKGTSTKIKDGVIEVVKGGIISEKYDLHMDFHEGKPIIVNIEANKLIEIEVKAWAQ